jgi:hypothetical protein
VQDEVEAAVVNLARWAGASRVDAAVEQRRREQLLRRQAEEEATLANLLAGLAERRADVALRTRSGTTHRGTVVGLGVDFTAVVTEKHVVLVPLAMVDGIRPEQSAAPAAFGDRVPTTGRLATVLAGLADDGHEVRLVTASETTSGEIVSVGDDVVTLRPAGAPRDQLLYVPAVSLIEVSLRLSG